MPKSKLIEFGNLIKRIYQERLEGNPEDLVRVWDEGEFFFVLRNDDTQAIISISDLLHGREDNIARALGEFQTVE